MKQGKSERASILLLSRISSDVILTDTYQKLGADQSTQLGSLHQVFLPMRVSHVPVSRSHGDLTTREVTASSWGHTHRRLTPHLLPSPMSSAQLDEPWPLKKFLPRFSLWGLSPWSQRISTTRLRAERLVGASWKFNHLQDVVLSKANRVWTWVTASQHVSAVNHVKIMFAYSSIPHGRQHFCHPPQLIHLLSTLVLWLRNRQPADIPILKHYFFRVYHASF